MKRWMGSAGHSARTSDHFCGGREDLGQFGQGHIGEEVFSALTTTARASMPTWNSTGVAADGLAQDSTSLSLMLAGGIGDVGLTGYAEALEAGAGADGVDGDVAG